MNEVFNKVTQQVMAFDPIMAIIVTPELGVAVIYPDNTLSGNEMFQRRMSVVIAALQVAIRDYHDTLN